MLRSIVVFFAWQLKILNLFEIKYKSINHRIKMSYLCKMLFLINKCCNLRLKSKLLFCLGNSATVADYYVATVLRQLEWVNFEFQLWPKLLKWFITFKELELWKKIHEKHDGFVEELKKQSI